jgi:hypothetical protein
MEDRNAGDLGHGPDIPFTVLLFIAQPFAASQIS